MLSRTVTRRGRYGTYTVGYVLDGASSTRAGSTVPVEWLYPPTRPTAKRHCGAPRCRRAHRPVPRAGARGRRTGSGRRRRAHRAVKVARSQSGSGSPQSRQVVAIGTTMKQFRRVVSRSAGVCAAAAVDVRLRAVPPDAVRRGCRCARSGSGASTVGLPPSAGTVAPKWR